jgi:beta-glucuronidase
MIKRLFLLTIFIITIITIKMDDSLEIPQIGNIFNRKKISLNGKWNYIIDVQEEGYYGYRMDVRKRGFFVNEKPKNPDDLIEYDFDKAPEMEIPTDWNTKNNKLFFYEGTIWFKKSFNYTINQNKKIILYFGAVNYETIVYINGILIGKHIGGFTPFNFDITSKIKNGNNFIILKIDNKRKKENIPTLIFDWWNYGGITRDVYLIETNLIYIQNYHLYLNKQNKKQIYINIQLNNNIPNKSIEISIPELNIKKYFYLKLLLI